MSTHHKYQIKNWTYYYVDKTKIDWDIDYFSRFVGHDPNTDPGMGLYQNRHGKFNIPIVGVNIISVEKKHLHVLQKRYQIESGFDEDFVICPTLHSILTDNIPLPFRVNHDQFKPTHKLVWISNPTDYPDSHWVLEGRFDIKSGTEVTFDYNYGSVVYKF